LEALFSLSLWMNLAGPSIGTPIQRICLSMNLLKPFIGSPVLTQLWMNLAGPSIRSPVLALFVDEPTQAILLKLCSDSVVDEPNHQLEGLIMTQLLMNPTTSIVPLCYDSVVVDEPYHIHCPQVLQHSSCG
jgi:hypothetical protein